MQEKQVTIVHAGTQLLNSTYPNSFRRAAEASVRERGVDVILGDAIDHFPEAGSQGVTTRQGRTLDADLVVSHLNFFSLCFMHVLNCRRCLREDRAPTRHSSLHLIPTSSPKTVSSRSNPPCN